VSELQSAESEAESLAEQLETMVEDGALSAEKAGMVGAAYRLVDTFSSLLNKKMWLKNGQTPCTDGHEIMVPYRHDFMYQYTEHEIAHNLFQSSFTAKEVFCDKYVEQIDAALKQNKVVLTVEQRVGIRHTVGMMLNVLEDHRINSLWSTLYEGSYALMQEQAQTLLKRLVKPAKTDLTCFFLLVAYQYKTIPQSTFSALQPAMAEAIKKVAYKGPTATFVVGKWLLSKMVDFFVQQAREQQQQQSGSAGQGQQGQGDGQDQQDQQDQQQGSQDQQQSQQGQQGQEQAQGGAQDQQGQQQGQQGQESAPAKASFPERIDALQKLVKAMQQDDAAAKAASRVKSIAEDVRKDRFEKGRTEAEKRVSTALGINLSDDSVESFLRTSEAEMQKTLAQIEDVLKSNTSKRSDDDIMRRGVAGSVTFKDIKRASVQPSSLSPEDARAVQRLRELFRRVHTRKVKQRYESGSEVDIETVIYNRANNMNEPCFKDEGSGRGFKVMVLVDRSGSMSGIRSFEAERACRMLRKALKQPNIDTVVWGFSGGPTGSTAITRIAPNLDVSESREMPCNGNTPMGQAIRVATNYLAQGTQKKHLVVITDGMPNASTNIQKMGRAPSATEAVTEEVNRARKMGVHVTAITLGVGVSEAEMKEMFGSEKSWAIAPRAEDLAPKLLKTTTSSFIEFLKQA
jgi:uncharacterized protein with von Willebrand factor type A (vWA) domain